MNKTVLFLLFVFVSVFAEGDVKRILANNVTKEEQKEIINVHNELRLLLANGKVPKQPRATNMKELCWDNDLAKAAQILADNMTFKHEVVKDDRWDHIGQNLAERSSTNKKMNTEWRWAIKIWFNEVKHYTYGDMPLRGTGHYTQIAWAKTTHVGCGYTHFIDPTQRLKYKKLYVCNYGPGGNRAGMEPYKTGRCGCIGLCKSRCKPKKKPDTKKHNLK